MKEAPRWLEDEPWLKNLLNELVDRLERPRKKRPVIIINEKNLPALYRFNEDTDARWLLLQQLEQQYPVFEIEPEKKNKIKPYEPVYERTRLRLRHEAEDLLRSWLKRPRCSSELMAWQTAVEQHAERFDDRGTALLSKPIGIAGRSADEIVHAFTRINAMLPQQLTLREVSAHCFWGDSKFLDGREDILLKLFGNQVGAIRPRPLLLTAFAPAHFAQLLIVENQDSFLRLATNPLPATALLYSAGFRAGASRLTSDSTVFSFLPGSDAEEFVSRWRDPNLPVFFWGDLDFAGMRILTSLRQSLSQLNAWKPGYDALLQRLESGQGHAAEQAGKEKQTDPGSTGCEYADQVLLPAIRKHNVFIDQESWRP